MTSEAVGEDDTQRYVLAAVGTVEAATIDARLDRTESSVSPAAILRRQPVLPDPNFSSFSHSHFCEEDHPSSPPPPFRIRRSGSRRDREHFSSGTSQAGESTKKRNVDDPVYRVYQARPAELEALHQKVNYLAILEQEALENERKKAERQRVD